MAHLYGFEIVREQDIPELNTHARLFRHAKTGAELLSLENDDENKVFGITFRTPPSDSTGIAHILEHSVLCGSRKYPLKEPFVELIKGSLKTFLNAFTYPDKTCYPVASTNLKDFYNLIDVYLDAVFYPRLSPQILQQEGWHYHLERPEDQMIFKGVVYNEMKGAYSSPDSLLHRYSQRALFPDTTYGVDSGGDPRSIPDLTYEQFQRFHQTLYHPANARIFFYGDDPLEERLRLVDAYLRDFDRAAAHSEVQIQEHFTETRRIAHSYAAGADAKAMMTVNWMLDEAPDPATTLGLNILEHILIGTSASPLRKALIDSGLGEDLAGSSLKDGLRQFWFSVGMKGIAVDSVDTIETLVIDTLQSLVEEGIDPDTVAASLNTIEFSLRENNTGSYPRGLLLMIRALSTWLHDDDPFAQLAFEAPLVAIKARLAHGERYFEELIQTAFLQNAHRVTLLLQPDPNQAEQEAATEGARLDAAHAAMSPEEIQAIVAQTRELQLKQETPDPPELLATIPSLTLADLDKQNKTIPRDELDLAGTRVLSHPLATNGIVYLDIGLNLRTLPPDLLPYVALFGRALTEMGTERDDFVRLSQRIGRTTGGVYSSTFASLVQASEESTAWLFVHGKALADQVDELLAILRDVLLSVRLDNPERFRQIVLKAKAGNESSLTPSGHNVVAKRLGARFNEANWAIEQTSGVDYLFFLRKLVTRIENDWPTVLANLEAVRHLLVNRATMICNVTADAAQWATLQPRLQEFLETLPAAPTQLSGWTFSDGVNFEGLTIPAQVNYVGKGTNIYKLGYRYHGSAAVITRYIRTNWLWDRVRVQGGAYGGFCSFNRSTGILSYTSYRDPNLLRTLDIYDQTGAFLRQADLNQGELTRSIIGAIGDMDAYQLPDAKGYTSMVRYLTGLTDPMRQQIRDEILATTAVDFRAFADVLDEVRDSGLVVVMGSPSSITAANEARGGIFEVLKVM
ncbi:MAG: insulinase family protein [Chloroflexales bacterium]|nr:insulinase family protein [Chloroflexales bacterium]